MVLEKYIDKLAKIKLLAMDVDGTLTDKGVYYSVKGEELKRFNVHDGMGLTLVHQGGIKTLLISSDPSEIPTRRVEKLGITHQIAGAKHKLPVLKELLSELKLQADEVAYIGDDINDLESIKFVGFSASPADATDIIRQNVDCVLDFNVGCGAVRQLCEMILLAQGKSIILT